jgi:hypothetical protein
MQGGLIEITITGGGPLEAVAQELRRIADTMLYARQANIQEQIGDLSVEVAEVTHLNTN